MLYSRSLLVTYFIYGSESHLVVSNSFVTPKEYSLPGSSVHGISQARILERVAISFSQGYSGIFLTQGSNSGVLHRSGFFTD